MGILDLFRLRAAEPRTMRGAGANRRMATRQRQRFVEGTIGWPTMLAPRLCRLLDMSATGAQVHLALADTPSSKVPAAVVLKIPADRCQVAAKVVWRKGQRLGLRFTGGWVDTV